MALPVGFEPTTDALLERAALTWLSYGSINFKVHDDRKMREVVRLVEHRGIHEEGLPDLTLTSSHVVNVPKDVQARLYLPDPLLKVPASDVFSMWRLVKNAHRGAMRDQDIDARRDVPPLLAQSWTAWKVESPLKKLRLPWAPIELEAHDIDTGVLKISNSRRNDGSRQNWILLEEPVMIPGNQNLMTVPKTGKPLEKVGYFSK